MTAVQQTSLKAFYGAAPDERSLRRKMVFDALLAGPANDRMLAARTGLPINCVTPRRGELVKLGLVAADGRFPDPASGRETIFWRAAGSWRT